MHLHSPRPSQELLALAIAIEDDHITNYREWALRFRPFDMGLGLILEMLTREMEGHKGMLLCHASETSTNKERIRRPAGYEAPTDSEHFFILDAQTAKAVLKAALKLKEQARRFYNDCHIGEPQGSRLARLYQNLSVFKEPHIQILHEQLTRV